MLSQWINDRRDNGMKLNSSAPISIIHAVMAPIVRINIPPPLTAWIVAIYEALCGDILTGIIFLLLASSIWDTMYGRKCARATGRYDKLKSEMGFHSKVMGIVLVLLIRGFEIWWAASLASTELYNLHTHGALAAAIAVTLFRNDLKSIQEHRKSFGQGDIPILGRILSFMDMIANKLGAPVNTIKNSSQYRETEK